MREHLLDLMLVGRASSLMATHQRLVLSYLLICGCGLFEKYRHCCDTYSGMDLVVVSCFVVACDIFHVPYISIDAIPPQQ